MLPIRIAVGEVNVDGELNDTECARALQRALPLTAEFRVWGDEMHLDVDLDEVPTMRPAATVGTGDVALAVDEPTLCIFFGPTPLSPAEDPVSAVPVIVVGQVQGVEALRGAKLAGEVTICVRNGREGREDG